MDAKRGAVPLDVRLALSTGRTTVEAAAARGLSVEEFKRMLAADYPGVVERMKRRGRIAAPWPSAISTALTGRMVTTMKAGELRLAEVAARIGCKAADLRSYLDAHHPDALAGAALADRPPGFLADDDLLALASGRVSLAGLSRRTGVPAGVLRRKLARAKPLVLEGWQSVKAVRPNRKDGHWSTRITSWQIRQAVAGLSSIASLAAGFGVSPPTMGAYLRTHHAYCRG